MTTTLLSSEMRLQRYTQSAPIVLCDDDAMSLRILEIVFSVPAFLYLLFWVGLDIFNVMKPSVSNVAHWAHIGGFFAGIAMMFVVTMFVPAPAGNPLEHLDT